MDSGLVPEQSERGTAAAAQLMESVDAWFEAPGASGIVPTLARSPEFIRAPDTLVRRTLGAMCNAAYSTIYASIGNATLALLEHPEALRRLKEDNELAVTGADELIRFDGPAQGTSRVATVETTIDDTTIERGHVVLTLFGAANRDPAQFASPNELVLDRSPNRHLGFGWGAHACFGAEPARHALREYVARLAAFPRTLELAGEPRRRPTATLRWLQMLPVAFH